MPSSTEENFRRREQDLKERELDIRLRELEHEIDKDSQSPVEPGPTAAHEVEVTTDEPNAGRKKRSMTRKIMNVGKLFVLMCVVIAAMRIAYWLATLIMVGTIIFTAYMLFVKGD